MVTRRLLCLFLVAFLTFSGSMGQLPSQDILALLSFKKGIKHDPAGRVLSSWNEESIDFNGCPASWYGIVCNGGNVAGVVLDNLGLSADADLSVFANLTMLVKLSMSKNAITGKIPDNIGSFKKLEYLDISDNLFTSSLPAGISSLSSLRNLSISGNNFSGSIKHSITGGSGLSSIQSIDLSRNSFSGAIPSSLTKLDSLVYLNLSYNRFEKTIPRGFELLSELQVLDLHDNMLSGALDEEFLHLSTAIYVDLSSNNLTCPNSLQEKFRPSISDTVKHLNLSHNQLTGSLVSVGEPLMFENIKVLDLSYNQFSGELPEFNFVYDLEVLRLSNNRFSGFVPNDLLKGDALVLTELDLSGNNLSGPISMITSTTLQVLNLSSNGLSGELPILSGECTILDLSSNNFEGNLSRVSKWQNVEFLDLSQNRLTGTFPEVTSQFLRLNHLNLSHNSLHGSLPQVITQFPKLSILDLSFNRLDGSLQPNIFSMPTLEELYLAGNSFTGDLQFSSRSSSDSKLRVLDLSHNSFDGYFPDKFGSLAELQILILAENNLSGSLPTTMNDMTNLTSLDMSQNQFTGPLPSNLSSNLLSFNVSYNDLSGTVPENLRHFPQSSFYPGNSRLQLPNSGSENPASIENSNRRRMRNVIKVVIIVACVVGFFILVLLAIFLHYIRISRKPVSDDGKLEKKEAQRRFPAEPSGYSGSRENPRNLVVSAEDLMSRPKGSSSEILSPDEKMAAVTGLSPSKSNVSWSPESGDSFAGTENLPRLDVRSPDQLAGELNFLDDSISLTPEELSKAPAEVLGRSSHGTSYRATLENGVFLTVKWLREGVARPRKDFCKEAKKFSNIRHPNVVALRGYYWGPTQHEKLILSDYISPGSLASFLYDRPGRKGPPLTWDQRLKIAVDVARGLNYLHFDRALPHGNLKATNILLEGQGPAELNARVADYCLHRLMTQAGTHEQILDAGVLGYRAPELAASKKPLPSFKSDVYAFGVILLEILTGKCAGDVVSGGQEGGGVDLTDWVRLRVAEGRGPDCFDMVLSEEMGSNPSAAKGMKDVLGIALRCIRSVSERPGIKTIYEDLSSI